MEQAEASLPPGSSAPKAPRPPRPRRRPGGISLTLIFSLCLVAAALGLASLALTGKTLRLPVWAVAEMEARLNRAVFPVNGLPEGAAASIGGVDVTLGRDFGPRFVLLDLRVLRPGGTSLVTLPEVHLALDGAALLRGEVQAQALRISGARLSARRARDGSLDFSFGGAGTTTGPTSLGAVLEAVERAFALPRLAGLARIEADALSLSLSDARTGRSYDLGDGRVVIENRAGDIAAELGLTLLGRARPARATVTVTSSKSDQSARMSASFADVAAADLAAQASPLAWLSVIDAPISGALSGGIDAEGRIGALEGTLVLAPGALRPGDEADPIAFDTASIGLRYDPQTARIGLQQLTVQSPSLRLRATGHAYLLDAAGLPLTAGQVPEAYLGQLAFSEVKVDPAGLFVAPVQFSSGALDVRLRLNPFRFDIGQLSLSEGADRLVLTGRLAAEPEGWQAALDVDLNQIDAQRLLTLWPVKAVPRTREWLSANVQDGQLFDVTAALRLAPGRSPRFSLGYEFADTTVRVIRTLPPVEKANGHATVSDNSYTMVLDEGFVDAPQGGRVDVAGSVFRVPDILARPTLAEIALNTKSSLTAILSLLDEPPFEFLTKAGQPVTLGEGEAEFSATFKLPLVPKILLPDVEYSATGTIRNFRSDVIVPKRQLRAAALRVDLDKTGLRLSGEGTLGDVPFDVIYAQGFGPAAKGKASVEGTVTLSDAVLREFGIDLPAGSVGGEGTGQITIDLQKGKPAQLRLLSDLNRLTLRLDALGWTKPAATRGRLEAQAILGAQPEITRLSLQAPGLEAQGRVTTRAGGGLDRAVFDPVRAGEWLDATVELQGRGKGQPVGLAVTGGSLDLRYMPQDNGGGGGGGGGSGQGGAFSLTLDQVIATSSLAFRQFRGEFTPRGGLNGTFTALVNGAGPVRGTVVPGRSGSAVRLQSDDAGLVLSAAGVFAKGRGGTLDLRLSPNGARGHFVGRAEFKDMRVKDAPALAELISAISVVGLLEQMNGNGLLFNEGEADFVLTPDAVEVRRASAVGLSLGLSMAGTYRTAGARLNMEGVISPIYLVNGIGALFTRRGEGVFGFNYRLTGSANDPDVDVNPLSIFTPGMFRDLFRRAPPKIKDTGG